MNVPTSPWMAFVLLPHSNPLPTWTHGYLFQCLYKTRSYSLKECVYSPRLCSWRDKIWFFLEQAKVFDFRLNIFTRFLITLFNELCTRFISKNIILSPQKLSRKVENRIVIVKNIYPCGGLFSLLCSLLLCSLFLLARYNFFTLIRGMQMIYN